ncbi:M20/M25/M40 family metallo-hydrolase [Staphylococcus auricularis]|nr:M20/M25/M40 family metallo-hydrolase [Staphylococcus auricularis]MCE5038123.1 M20/M25/M40 family metallo-hydrolase [Staphylococcus auricularis]MEB6569358.1 M20/M25/M40 family metallo-hydrolase [Staphylococcus auricularis]
MDKDRLLRTFLELVKINSETGYETTLHGVLKRMFHALDLTVQEDQAGHQLDTHVNNLIVSIPATAGYAWCEPICFTAHMDTVTPGAKVKPQIDEDGYIYSDGTTILGADDKAGLTAMIELVRILKEDQIAHGAIQLIITVQEEVGLQGAKALDPSLLNAEYGFTVDAHAAIGTTIVASPYQSEIEIVLYGSRTNTNHSSSHVSAITLLTQALRQLRSTTDDQSTIQISHFEGDSGTETLQDRVTLTITLHSFEKDLFDAQFNHIKETFQQIAHNYQTGVEVNVKQQLPGFNLQPPCKAITLAQASATALNLSATTTLTQDSSDGNILNELGIPTVILGVGYENIHTTAERISIESLYLLTRQLVEIVKLSRQSDNLI